MTIHVTPIPRLTTLVAPAFTLGTTNAAGSAITAVPSDSTILTYDTTVPASIAASSAVGSATTAARRDHVHNATSEIGVFKGYALIQFSGGTPSATASQNVSAVGDQGGGETRITWDTDFANANMIALITTRQEEETSTASFATTNQVADTSMDVKTYDASDASVLDETFMLAAWGTQ